MKPETHTQPSVLRIKELIKKIGVNKSPGSSVTPGWTYNPIPFDDFKDIPCHRADASWKRWEAIKKAVNFDGAIVLDIGANVGFFTFKIAQDFKPRFVYALETDLDACLVGRQLKSHYDYGNIYFTDKISWWMPDIVLALSVLNWMGREESESFFRNHLMTCRALFVEMPLKNDGMRGAEWLRTEEDLVNWLYKHTKFNTINGICKTMGPGGKERMMYVCYNEKTKESKREHLRSPHTPPTGL